MASTPRHNKQGRKGGQEPVRRAPAWTGARASPTFSPSNTPRPQSTQSPSSSANFPSLGQANGGIRSDPPRDRVLQSLAGLTGMTVTLLTKTGQRYEGTVSSTSNEGDTTGVTLKDVKEISNPGAPLKDSLFIASTNIDSFTPGAADVKPPNGDSFRTDTEISGKKAPARERELKAWADDDTPGLPPVNDDDTFGPNASAGNWDQFSANEKLFGVKASFDENVYTTKLDRNAPDFKERERKAMRIANEIMGSAANNPHIAEERGLIDDSGINEEDKYGAVVRGANAYIPPARRAQVQQTAAAPGPPGPAPAQAPAKAPEIPKVSVNGPDGNAVAPAKAASPAPGNATTNNANKPPADPLPAFRDFVTNEKQRLNQKRQALVKNEMDKRMAELVKFSQSFKLNKPIPDDLVPILAKDEEKQKAIREKANRDAASAQARAIGASTPTTASRGVLAGNKINAKPAVVPSVKPLPGNLSQTTSSSAVPKAAGTTASSSSPAVKSSEATPTTTKKISMVIQPIPPFKGPKKATAATPSTNGATNKPTTPGQNRLRSNSPGSTPLSPATAANRLNVNAPSFRVKGSVSPSLSSASASASPKPKSESAPATPNPFFGNRPIKKNIPVNVKDDFNPFKHNKVADASQVAAVWPYSGKRYMAMYPPQHPPSQHPPHMNAPPVPSPMPPPSYEEDSAAQAAAAASARGYVYAYPPYAYPGQPMMPGMPPPGPPGAFMPGPYMQPMPYPPGMPPPNAMYSPGMAQMPPYMPPPPGAYPPPPPPNGAGPRPSMPPTPIPTHAHPYYHQSPQMQHAVPYPMMMPPPPAVPGPHPYDGQAPPPPVQMGGHA
ncbi:hypothetical protein CC2G_007227 [Coprinopsis cinerea AmutBmut pab1-1]|nr:hypothetical protein CC2G_007227 [Coprinopsis cinerea AmutBmut pab1-1]